MNEQLDRIERKLIELEGKIDETAATLHKMRRYTLWAGIITVAVIVIPLLLLPAVLPGFLTSQGVGASGF